LPFFELPKIKHPVTQVKSRFIQKLNELLT